MGLARTALAGSRAAIGGISISPAPRLPRDDRELPDLVRPDVVRRLPLPVDSADPEVGADPDDGPGADPAVTPADGWAETTAAIPQTSQ
jgi:hypothetical protein